MVTLKMSVTVGAHKNQSCLDNLLFYTHTKKKKRSLWQQMGMKIIIAYNLQRS